MRIAGHGLQQCGGTRECGLFGTVRQRTSGEFAQLGGIGGVAKTLIRGGQRFEIGGNRLHIRPFGGVVSGMLGMFDVLGISHSLHLTPYRNRTLTA